MMQLLKNTICKLGSLGMKTTDSLFHAQTAQISSQEILELDAAQKRKM
jgi:hypothetical protein